MLKSYRYPVMRDYNFYFNRAWENAQLNLKEKFVPSDTMIFKDVNAWRLNTAKFTDNNIQNLISDFDALKFCVMKPINIDMLHEISYKFELLTADGKYSLLSIISRFNGTVTVEAVPPESVRLRIQTPKKIELPCQI